MKEISAVLTVLSAMITPAVLILASGSLLLTTSQRLNRAIDRSRTISDSLEEMKGNGEGTPADLDEKGKEKKKLLSVQLVAATKRAWLLQRAISSLCITLSIFVATSMSIGIIELTASRHTWIPTILGLCGIGTLFYSTVLFVLETRIAYRSVQREMAFILKSSLESTQTMMRKEKV
jgi:hypothetical protein